MVLRLEQCSRTGSAGVRPGGWTSEGFFPRQEKDCDETLSDLLDVTVKRPMKRETTYSKVHRCCVSIDNLCKSTVCTAVLVSHKKWKVISA